MSDNPYPGLLYFTPENSHLFFGRENQTDALLGRLTRSRLLAVVGTSGSGKSSLVRAGLLPALWAGYLKRAGADWMLADFRPGSDPIGNLATQLAAHQVFGDKGAIEADLRQSSLALTQLIQTAELGRRNVLVLVDQFEELFRVRTGSEERSDHDEKAAFVKLILHAARAPELSIYVVITMRSDFLGDCAKFRDLPEAMSDGQYLIPRLTREQQRSAIEGPARIAGGTITNRLVQQLLNDTSRRDDQDQLPLLQHALMRTWSAWRKTTDVAMDLVHYAAIGTMSDALSKHAEEAFAEAVREVPRGAQITRRIFQRLAGRDDTGRETRRKCEVAELAAVAGATPEQVIACLASFRDKQRAFVMPQSPARLTPREEVDVTHECLLRQWHRLRTEWIPEELEACRTYRKLLDRAEDGVPLTGRALFNTVDWWDRREPNAAWARRYGRDFDRADLFKRKSQRRRWVKLGAVFAVGLLFAGYCAFMAQQKFDSQVATAKGELERGARTNAITLMMARTAASLVSNSTSIEPGALLAATANYRRPTSLGSLEAHDALTRALSALPVSVRAINVPRTKGLAFGALGRRLALASESGRVTIFDTETLKPIGQFDAGGIPQQIEFDSDGTHIAVGMTDRVSVLRLSEDPGFTAQVELTFECVPEFWVSISGAGDRLLATCGGRLRSFEARAGVWQDVAVKDAGRAFGWQISLDGNQRASIVVPGGKYTVLSTALAKSEVLTMPERLDGYLAVRSNLSWLAWSIGTGYIDFGSVGEDTTPVRVGAVGPVDRFVLGDNGQVLAAAIDGGVAQLWTLPDGAEQLRRHYSSRINDLAVDEARGTLAVALDETVEVVRLTAAQYVTLRNPIVTSGGFVTLDVGARGTPLVLRIEGGASTASKLEIKSCTPSPAVALSADATRAAYMTCEGNEPALKMARRDGRASWSDVRTWTWSGAWPRRLVFSDDGRRLVAWRWRSAASNTTSPQSPARAARSSLPPGSPASDGNISSLRLFDDEGSAEARDLDLPSNTKFWDLARSGKGVWAVVDGDKASVQRIDFDGRDWNTVRIAVERQVTAFAISPTEHRVALAAVRMGPVHDSTTGASATNSVASAVIWDPDAGTRVELSTPDAASIGVTASMAFAPDGQYLATADGSTVRVWNLAGGLVARFQLSAAVTQVAFSQDGQQVVAVSDDRAFAFFWDEDRLRNEVCARIGRDLTAEEWARYVPNEPYDPLCKRGTGVSLE